MSSPRSCARCQSWVQTRARKSSISPGSANSCRYTYRGSQSMSTPPRSKTTVVSCCPGAGPSVSEGLRRGAGADQVAVAVGLVDPAHRGPVLAPAVARQRIGRLLPLVVVLPVGGEQHGRCVRGAVERVVLR